MNTNRSQIHKLITLPIDVVLEIRSFFTATILGFQDLYITIMLLLIKKIVGVGGTFFL
jgi:hypothetical protein